MKKLAYGAAGAVLLLSAGVQADTALLSPEEAFPLTVMSSAAQQAELSWNIPPNYYLYQHKISVQQGSQPLALNMPPAESLHDDNFGQVQVYYDQLQLQIPTQASQQYHVTWQGCAKDRVCYPPQNIDFQTDANGLVSVQNHGKTKQLLDLAGGSNLQNTVLEAAPSASSTTSAPAAVAADQETAKDQMWSEKLAESSLAYGLLLFFGLGILLAFTPCSLPMLPILTSLIVRDSKGLKAWMIALTFVCSMAMVYAVLGLIASSAGLNFQRWLQQPSTLIAFSLLFVVFALNLFGLFEIKLPRALLQRLDHAQSMQKGGSLLGAGVMGMISALLVGPCMTAPLAGALLFISQTQSQWQGALLLFTLGFGMGTPLLLASVLGSRILPKAGMWMNQIKVLFAFIMLGLALYFIRPLLSEAWMQWLSLALELSFVGYVLWRILGRSTSFRWLYILVLCAAVPYAIYSQYQQSQRFFAEQATAQAVWHQARTAAEFQQLLSEIPAGQKAVIDVYADWCVACQPIEHRILKSASVQQALAPYYLIKLDLSHYDETHQVLLNQWDILGPPTYLFLDEQHQEVRGLRLTGAFTQDELLQQLKRF
ncbi:protein-disulfide reductase DsbD [Acinetobacter sp. ANC 3813]|uniref:protein-disulfide reductase DsbD n=1 Tax=Acinetobacter sp. ANC 3813 TaxID=1977873 RepID=UPI000A352611|nr:protein-disulfide reductase DsbD [Acinetobacter sp. ANC 3813]OTG92260.1 thiol:disulfide interchange protein [Acinetobacter sp. ANC 3813]